mmetsp:Transcript_12237/g.31310  ORF Transcript_12237/g.31310 Transcript_12237/m.31310 type:complete len:343 (-) Transcript_12237:26-1054(-)
MLADGRLQPVAQLRRADGPTVRVSQAQPAARAQQERHEGEGRGLQAVRQRVCVAEAHVAAPGHHLLAQKLQQLRCAERAAAKGCRVGVLRRVDVDKQELELAVRAGGGLLPRALLPVRRRLAVDLAELGHKGGSRSGRLHDLAAAGDRLRGAGERPDDWRREEAMAQEGGKAEAQAERPDRQRDRGAQEAERRPRQAAQQAAPRLDGRGGAGAGVGRWRAVRWLGCAGRCGGATLGRCLVLLHLHLLAEHLQRPLDIPRVGLQEKARGLLIAAHHARELRHRLGARPVHGCGRRVCCYTCSARAGGPAVLCSGNVLPAVRCLSYTGYSGRSGAIPDMRTPRR